VARQTRSQRRARRAAQEQSQAQGQGGGIAQRARTRQQQMRPSQQPQKSQTGTQRSRVGGGTRGFIGESWAELKKVEWPGQSQVIQATVVVLIACVVVGTYLYIADQIWKPTAKWIIGQ
jgi:preprotein translocase SecE subunit